MKDEHSTRDVLLGTLAGAAIGAGLALLLAPKSGEELRGDIKDLYDDMCDKTGDFADDIKEKTQNLASQLKDKTQDLVSQFHDKKEDFVESVHLPENMQDSSSVLMGAIGGAIVGLAAALLVSSKNKPEIQTKYDQIKDWAYKQGKKRSKDWLDKSHDIVDNLKDTYNDIKESGIKSTHYKKIDDLLDWITLGLHVVNKIQKR